MKTIQSSVPKDHFKQGQNNREIRDSLFFGDGEPGHFELS